MKTYTSLIAAALLCIPFTETAQQLKLTSDNINQILQAMTLEEKAALLVGGSNKTYSGSNTTIGYTEDIVPGAAGVTQAIERLGIPATVMADGTCGVRIQPTRKESDREYLATAFPIATALASTWNPATIESVGKATGEEALSYGIDVMLSPGMNIHRSPLCGRNFEYFSEDPVLAGKSAAAFVRGVQSQGVGTSVKHFAANSQETNRNHVNEVIAQRPLRELYLKGFEIAVKEGRPWTIMSSYNRLNGHYTQENRELLTDILRDEWGYEGVVVTDWIGRRNTMAQVHAGNDLMQPGSQQQSRDIVEKVNSGELSMEDVDNSVRRMLEYIVKTPTFNGHRRDDNPDFEGHAAVARKAGAEGMVLLKNDEKLLPLKDVEKVALFGLSSYDLLAGGTGSGNVCKPYTVNIEQGLERAGFKMSDELSKLYNSYFQYQQAKDKADRLYFDWRWGRDRYPEPEIAKSCVDKQAEDADIAIVTIGRQAGEDRDRKVDNDFTLSQLERKMLEDICGSFHEKGKKVVAVINSGSVIETSSWKDLPDAILLAWQPGEEGGNAVADILTGKVNPSGKLPMTFPVNVMDHPSSRNFPTLSSSVTPPAAEGANRWAKRNVDYTLHQEGLDVGYRYFATEGKPVSYPFGYGLSYTDFSYTRPVVKADKEGFTASVTVTNTGKIPGSEAVQLYVTAPDGELEKPEIELKSFGKTRELKPGESQTLTFSVTNYDLASFNESTSSWVSDKGKYTVKFGASSADIRAKATYTLPKALTWPVHNVLRPDISLK